MSVHRIDFERIQSAIAAIDAAIERCTDKQELFRRLSLERLTLIATSSNGINTSITSSSNVNRNTGNSNV